MLVNWESAVSVILGVTASIVGATWWLSDQLRKNRDIFYKQMAEYHNQMTMHMDNHEKEDNIRFNALSNSIWQIRMRNAAIDGHKSIELEDK